MKRILVGLLLIGCITFSLSAAGKQEADAGGPVELVWSGWSGEEGATAEAIQQMMSSYNDGGNDATVSWIGWPWSKTLEQLIIRTKGGQALDVAQIDMGWLASLAEMDILEDMNELIGTDWIESNLSASGVKAGVVDGKQVALPWTSASIGMVCNPSLLKTAGADSVPVTIGEFEDVLRMIKKANPDSIPYAMVTKDAGSMGKDFHAWLWTFGGNVFDAEGNVTINNSRGLETLNWFIKLKDEGLIRMDVSRFDARQYFAQGMVGFYDDAIMANGIAKSNGVAEDELDTRIQPVLRPVLKAGDAPQSVLWGHQLVIFKSTSSSEKSADFLKSVLGKENALLYFEKTGTVPTNLAALTDQSVQSNRWVNDWMEITKTGRKAETQFYAVQSELHSIITEECQAALLGQKTAQKALDDAAKRIKLTIE